MNDNNHKTTEIAEITDKNEKYLQETYNCNRDSFSADSVFQSSYCRTGQYHYRNRTIDNDWQKGEYRQSDQEHSRYAPKQRESHCYRTDQVHRQQEQTTMKKLLTMMLFITSLNASAGDFLFQVPVKLNSIPKGIPQAKVLCNVFTFGDDQNPIATGYTIKSLHLGKGSLNQEIEVRANYRSMSRYMKPHQYQCHLLLLIPWAKPTWQTPSREAGIRALQDQG